MVFFVSPSLMYISFILGKIPDILLTSNSFWKLATILCNCSVVGRSPCKSAGPALLSWHSESTAFFKWLTTMGPASFSNKRSGCHGNKCAVNLLIDFLRSWMNQIGRAHVWTPVTPISRMPSSAWKKKKTTINKITITIPILWQHPINLPHHVLCLTPITVTYDN